LYTDEIHNLKSSPNIIRVTKLSSMRWVGCVARKKEVRNSYKIMVEKREM